MRLWKAAVPAILCTVLASPCFAQVGGGVEAGANFSQLSVSGSDASGFEGGNKTGIIIGGFMSLPLNKTTTFMPEVAFAQKHSALNGSESGQTIEQNVILDMVEIPLLVKLTPPNARGFYVVVGPAVGFRTTAKIRDAKVNGQSAPEGDSDLKDETESTDFSLVFGAGCTKGKVAIEARYDHGLRNLNNDSSEDFHVKTRTFTVLLRVFAR
jgi:outer membrane protein with beta-barrel domain